jgi:REP element-mobilizing transposase RayT
MARSTYEQPLRFPSRASFRRNAVLTPTDECNMPRRSPALILVHAVWATSRRRPLLRASFDDTLLGILGAKARDLGCVLLRGGCAADHLHLLLRIAASTCLADVVQRIKGGGAYDANRHPLVPERIRWQDGYWAESFAPEHFDPLAHYVESQRTRHDWSHPAERWQFGDDGHCEPALLGGLNNHVPP